MRGFPPPPRSAPKSAASAPGRFPSHPSGSRRGEERSGLRARQSAASARLPSTPPLPSPRSKKIKAEKEREKRGTDVRTRLQWGSCSDPGRPHVPDPAPRRTAGSGGGPAGARRRVLTARPPRSGSPRGSAPSDPALSPGPAARRPEARAKVAQIVPPPANTHRPQREPGARRFEGV